MAADEFRPYDGPAISEQEHEVTQRAERPAVDTEAVAVERVRLSKQTVTDGTCRPAVPSGPEDPLSSVGIELHQV